jgi:tripartite-type tricarboxylate transporter receptor subunit TctC
VLRTDDGRLAKMVAADTTIDAVLHRFVDETPAIAYARVSIVHNGTMLMENIHLLHFSTIASVAAPSWPPMAMPQNHPLAEVRDFVAPVLEHPGCAVIRTNGLSDPATAARLLDARVGVVIDCSIFSPKGQFLGMLYANFRTMADLPSDLSAIMVRQRQAAAAIGAALVASAP